MNERTYNKLGVTLQKSGKLNEAKYNYLKAISTNPKFAEAYNNLGMVLYKIGKLDEAQINLNKAIKFKPYFAQAYNNLGIIFMDLGQKKDAEKSYKKALILKKDYEDAYINLGNLLKSSDKFEEAELCYKIAIKLKPDYAEAFFNLGQFYKDVGKLNEAQISYEKVISIRPTYAEAHRQLTLLKQFKFIDQQFIQMQNIYFDESTNNTQLCKINFGLAKAYEDLGNFEKAFKHFSEGNTLRKNELEYNFNKDLNIFTKIKKNHLTISRNSLSAANLTSKFKPIFIVGMPRSGTTLVEQIISSHSKITGAGELQYIDQFGKSLAQGMSVANFDALLNFRNKYISKLYDLCRGNFFVTDKMPQNFLYIGLISAAFPEAKIINVRRNPAALCWSNFKQYFPSKYLDYCYSLEDITRYYSLYEGLMKFWKKFYNNRIYNLDYEELTQNQKKETQKILNYLNLNWDEKCLSPEKNKRKVVTASNIQIRKKIYKGSSNDWKTYKKYLNGAFDIFNNHY